MKNCTQVPRGYFRIQPGIQVVLNQVSAWLKHDPILTYDINRLI